MSTTKKEVFCQDCGWKMKRRDRISYRDFDDVRRTARYVRWSCRKCGVENVNEYGEFSPAPLPPGVIVSGNKRPYCSKCGMKLYTTPISDYVAEDGRILHVPGGIIGRVTCFFCGHGYSTRPDCSPETDETFFSLLWIPDRIKELWNIDYKNILNSTEKATGRGLFKFCYCPPARQLILGVRPQDHKTLVWGFGRATSIRDYVRGIYFKEKNVIYLRMYENKLWLTETFFVLRRLGVPKSVPIIWGPDAARQLEKDLRGL